MHVNIIMLERLNGLKTTPRNKSFKEKSCAESTKSSYIIGPFFQQLKTFEQRLNRQNRKASNRFLQQSKQYRNYSASILKQTKQIINERVGLRFCDPQLLKIIQDNDSTRERENQVLDRVRSFRTKSFGSTRSKRSGNTSAFTEKLTQVSFRSKLRASGKENQVCENLKTFINYKKKPLRALLSS